MEQLSVDNLLGIKYIKRQDIDLIFDTANNPEPCNEDFFLYQSFFMLFV